MHFNQFLSFQMRRGIKLIKCFLTNGMIEDHLGRRLIPTFCPQRRERSLAPRALDHATHSVDRGHGSIYATGISVSYRRQHFVRFYRALVLNRTARARNGLKSTLMLRYARRSRLSVARLLRA
jgi:hypothetical protein